MSEDNIADLRKKAIDMFDYACLPNSTQKDAADFIDAITELVMARIEQNRFLNTHNAAEVLRLQKFMEDTKNNLTQ